MAEKSNLHKNYVTELENELREFEKKEDGVTKRMQMMVYPAMVAFFILAAYGFYLIQSLTTDMGEIAKTMQVMSASVTSNMDSLSSTTKNMSNQMENIVVSTNTMTNIMGRLSDTTGSMAQSTNNMQKDMWSLNQNVSTPLSMFNKFVPWNNNSSGRFPGSSTHVPNTNYQQYSAPPAQVAPVAPAAVPNNSGS